LPASILANRYAPQRSARELATVIVSRRSTGELEAVELTHANVLANVQALLEVLPLGPGDALLSVLPLSQAFGTTVGCWCVLLSGARAVLHPDPFDGPAIGRLCAAHGVSVMIGTPTLYRAWLPSLEAAQLARLRLALVGADALTPELARAWQERFGFTLFEGYGCNELSPVVAVGLPDAGDGDSRQVGNKEGTVGRPLPGVAVRIVDVRTRELLPPESEGLIQVKGPNLMRGYLDQPERTRQVVRDGWFESGDLGRLDADGFLVLTFRQGGGTVRSSESDS
jgi:acyl-[acyl-carrier-protein]-phospholipid O-acyltransferase/long-chain-fatty-acid--[acyl-carrier-protein] ligase